MPSRMNPVQEGANQFAELFRKMPAKRIGTLEDIAGAILYLCSQAGVRSSSFEFTMAPLIETDICLTVLRGRTLSPGRWRSNTTGERAVRNTKTGRAWEER